jgi:hypothetical protein
LNDVEGQDGGYHRQSPNTVFSGKAALQTLRWLEQIVMSVSPR